MQVKVRVLACILAASVVVSAQPDVPAFVGALMCHGTVGRGPTAARMPGSKFGFMFAFLNLTREASSFHAELI